MRTILWSTSLCLLLANAGCASMGSMGGMSNHGGYAAADEGMPPNVQLGL